MREIQEKICLALGMVYTCTFNCVLSTVNQEAFYTTLSYILWHCLSYSVPYCSYSRMCLCVVWLTACPEQASPGEVDAVYQVLKQAGEISTARSLSMRAAPAELPPARRIQQPPLSLRGASSLTVGPTPHASSSGLTLLTLPTLSVIYSFLLHIVTSQTVASICTKTSKLKFIW